MRWTTATGLFLVLAMGGAGTAFVLTREPMPPAEVLTEVRDAMSSTLFDEVHALRRLDRALKEATTTSDAGVAAAILQTRSQIYRGRGAYDRARADLETLLADYRKGDQIIGLDLARLEALDDELPMALQRTHDLIENDPELATAWELRGELEVATAREALDSSYEKIDAALARVDAGDAKALLEEIAARASDDTAIPALRFRLGDLSAATHQGDVFDALALIDAPRGALARARDAYARSIALEPTAKRVVALARLLTKAGQLNRAITLETSAQDLPSIAEDPDAFASLLSHLTSAGRMHEAVALLGTWDWGTEGTLEFYRSSGEIFYRSGNLTPLGPISTGLRQFGGDTGDRWALFYSSLGVINRARTSKAPEGMAGQLQTAVKRLRQFLDNTDEDGNSVADQGEPFEGAKTDAWFWLAEAYRYLGKPSRERTALRKGLALRPEHSADAWVRMAATMKASTKIPWIDVESALTEALDLAPERTSELVDDWLEAGLKTIETRGLTVTSLLLEAGKQKVAVPTFRKLGPAALTLLAQAHLQIGSGVSARRAASMALLKNPNLVAPRDVVIGAKLLEPGRFHTVERDIVSRIEVAGIDEQVERFLAQLPAGRLKRAELVRAIRAAPARFGKPAVARWYQERGEASRAGEVLIGLDPKNSPASLRLLYARTLVDGGEYRKAIKQLDVIADDRRAAPRALLLRAEALIRVRNRRQLVIAVRQFTMLEPDSTTLLEMADLLMENGHADLALAIVDRLDSDPATRTAEFYRRRVLVDILLAARRGPETAAESITRSEAYLRDGTAELASIVFAVAQREWRDLPVLVRRLRESGFRPTPEEDIALSLLEERLEAGRRDAMAALAASPRDPSSAFLTAAAASLVDARTSLPPWFGPRAAADANLLFRGPGQRDAKDPRDALMLFLVSRQAGWSPWVLPRLGKLREDTGSTIWASWLEFRIHEANGDDAAVRTVIARLVEVHRGFGPAHDLAVRLIEEDYPTEPLNPAVVRVRRMRLESLGEELIDDPVEVALAEAGDLYERREFSTAARRIQTVLDAGGSAAMEARVILGTLMLKLEQPSFAAQYMYEAAMGEPGVFRELVITTLLYSLRYSIANAESGTPQRGAIGRDRALEMLDALSQRYPLDPIIALTRLEITAVDGDERGARARGILGQLYERSGRKSLETLRPGSTRPWVEMLLKVAPEVAHDLVQRDLNHEPGNLTLWRLTGLVAEAQDLLEEARVAYEVHLAIDPASVAGYDLAAVLIKSGAGIDDLNSVLLSADRAQGGGGLRSTYLRALGQLRRPRPALDVLIPQLKELWDSRARAERELGQIEIGFLYADALFHRHSAEDMTALEVLFEGLSPIAERDPYAGRVVEALSGLHRELNALEQVSGLAPIDGAR